MWVETRAYDYYWDDYFTRLLRGLRRIGKMYQTFSLLQEIV